jgi:hypothetical protein
MTQKVRLHAFLRIMEARLSSERRRQICVASWTEGKVCATFTIGGFIAVSDFRQISVLNFHTLRASREITGQSCEDGVAHLHLGMN